MIRGIVYPGSAPQDTDILNIYRNAMIADGWLAQFMLGTSSAAVGLACTATGTMFVNIGGGAIAQQMEVDATAYGSLAANTNLIMKVAFGFSGVGIPLTAPTVSGDSVNYLIEAQITTSDATPVVLPYVNDANPAQPYSGPNNTGTPNNTQRADSITFQYIGGTPAPTGTQTTPATTSGWIPLYVVTVNYGQTSIPSGQIAVHPQAPFVFFPLQTLRPGVLTPFTAGAGSSGTFVVPPGVTLIKGTLTAGGGAGGAGGGSTGATYIGGGGSGGGQVKGVWAVTPGQQIPYAVGLGGVSGGAAATNTTLTGLAAATAGSAGSAGSGSAPGGGAMTAGGGSATSPVGSAQVIAGNTGQSGYAAGSSAVGGAGGGAESRATGTQNPVYSTSSSGTGLPGFGHGDGGSGGIGANYGGNGGGGFLLIEY